MEIEIWRAAVRAALADLPPEHAEKIAAASEMKRAFFEELALAMEGPMSERFRSLPAGNYTEMQQAAQQVSRELTQLGLAPCCPRTSMPARLTADYRDGGRSPRFRLVVPKADGTRSRTIAARDAFTLNLVEKPPFDAFGGHARHIRAQTEDDSKNISR